MARPEGRWGGVCVMPKLRAVRCAACTRKLNAEDEMVCYYQTVEQEEMRSDRLLARPRRPLEDQIGAASYDHLESSKPVMTFHLPNQQKVFVRWMHSLCQREVDALFREPHLLSLTKEIDPPFQRCVYLQMLADYVGLDVMRACHVPRGATPRRIYDLSAGNLHRADLEKYLKGRPDPENLSIEPEAPDAYSVSLHVQKGSEAILFSKLVDRMAFATCIGFCGVSLPMSLLGGSGKIEKLSDQQKFDFPGRLAKVLNELVGCCKNFKNNVWMGFVQAPPALHVAVCGHKSEHGTHFPLLFVMYIRPDLETMKQHTANTSAFISRMANSMFSRGLQDKLQIRSEFEAACDAVRKHLTVVFKTNILVKELSFRPLATVTCMPAFEPHGDELYVAHINCLHSDHKDHEEVSVRLENSMGPPTGVVVVRASTNIHRPVILAPSTDVHDEHKLHVLSSTNNFKGVAAA